MPTHSGHILLMDHWITKLIHNPLVQKDGSGCVQAAVVGMSCRSDVTEMLEKRVKSRFSYR